MNEKEVYHFLYRELLKLNNIIFAYDKIFKNINIKNDCYNQALQLILDSFTRNIAIELTLFFDKRKDVYSLYSFIKINKSDIDKIRKEAKPFLLQRYNQFAHLSKNFLHKDNFSFYKKVSIDKIKKIIENVDNLLQKVKEAYSFERIYLLNKGFQGMNRSFECLFHNLKK